MKSGPVVLVGEAVLEHVFEVPRLSAAAGRSTATACAVRLGGTAGQAAMAAQRLRHPMASPRLQLVSAVGEDDTGATLLHLLRREGLSRLGMQVVAGAHSPVTLVLAAAQGDRQVYTVAGDATERMPPTDTLPMADAAAVLVDARWPMAGAVLEACRRGEVPSLLCVEPGDKAVLQALAPLADWVVFSIDGLRAWAGERHAIWQTLVRQAARQLEQSQLVLHLGGAGAWWHAPGALPKLLPPPVPSPTPDRGSGADVLRGALVLGLAEGRSPDFAVRWALAAAALAGDGPAPDRASVIRVLAGTPRPSPHNATPNGG